MQDAFTREDKPRYSIDGVRTGKQLTDAAKAEGQAELRPTSSAQQVRVCGGRYAVGSHSGIRYTVRETGWHLISATVEGKTAREHEQYRSQVAGFFTDD